MKQNTDGTIDFELTDEEAREADLALQAFKGLLVHPDWVDSLRKGTTAVALSRYAGDLVRMHCAGLTQSELEADWPTIQAVIEKAVAAVWKAYSLYPLPIFLYHRASFLQMLGMIEEARPLFGSFVKKQSEFKADHFSTALITYEGTDIERALSRARREA